MSAKISHQDQISPNIGGCFLCGKELANEQDANFWVEIDMATNGVWSAAMGECETSQGCFPIGNGCAKKFEPGVLHQ
jgi:hypothetical protein